jgi:branched-chain amino acid transport system ATP-binding protein
MALLELNDVHTYYGAIHALRGVTLSIDEGEIVTLIGSNGAGKSTTLRTISGLLKPRQGQITLRGKKINGMPPHEIVGLGICQSPEGRRVFARMTVHENLEMGAFSRKDTTGLATDFERVYTLFPRLRERTAQHAGTLSGGEQQMLAMGRALMAAPKILLLDEPSMGLSPILVEQIFQIITEINKQGTTVLLVEQNALMALGVAHRGYILQTGEIVLTDEAAALARNPAVREAYLGGG